MSIRELTGLSCYCPILEQNTIYDQWDFNIPASQNPGRSAELSILKCPSDNRSTGNLCTYAGGGWARGNYGLNVAPCSHNLESEKTGAPSRLGGIGGVNYSVKIDFVRDGTSNTVAVDELRAGLNSRDIRGCWAMPGLGSGTAALFRDAEIPNPPWPHSDDMENCKEAGFEGDSSRGMGCYDPGYTSQMSARSFHPGGVHALMVDGSVRFVADTIEGNTTNVGSPPQGAWQAVHTRDGGEVGSEF
jgi:prepilin-type processing-associated H-X9-DG protein